MKGYSTLLVLKERNQNQNEIALTPTKMDITKKQLVQMLRNWSHHTLLEGMQTDAAIVEKIPGASSKKLKQIITI